MPQWPKQVTVAMAMDADQPARNTGGKKGTGPICRNGPEGALHKLDLSPFSRITQVYLVVAQCPCHQTRAKEGRGYETTQVELARGSGDALGAGLSRRRGPVVFAGCTGRVAIQGTPGRAWRGNDGVPVGGTSETPAERRSDKAAAGLRSRGLGGVYPRRQQADARTDRLGAEALLRHPAVARTGLSPVPPATT